MIPKIEHIANQLQQARKDKALSQRALGEKVGLPQGHISNIEASKVDLKTSSLIELARVLDLELMLVPRQLINAVEALKSNKMTLKNGRQRPAYELEDEEDEND